MLPTLPVDYASYSRWQRAALNYATMERQLDYWRHQLAGLQPLLLAGDHPRPPVQVVTFNCTVKLSLLDLTTGLIDLTTSGQLHSKSISCSNPLSFSATIPHSLTWATSCHFASPLRC